MPPGLSPVHLLVILVVALVVLGPDKMPDAVRKGARFLGEARQWSARMSEEVQNVVSMQTQDVMTAPAEHPTTPGGGDGSTSAQPEPATADAAAPEAGSTSSGDRSPDTRPTPASSPPAGFLPLIPKERS